MKPVQLRKSIISLQGGQGLAYVMHVQNSTAWFPFYLTVFLTRLMVSLSWHLKLLLEVWKHSRSETRSVTSCPYSNDRSSRKALVYACFSLTFYKVQLFLIAMCTFTNINLLLKESSSQYLRPQNRWHFMQSLEDDKLSTLCHLPRSAQSANKDIPTEDNGSDIINAGCLYCFS